MTRTSVDTSDDGAVETPGDINPAMVAALEHAQAGRPVFPCQQDKRPYTKDGFKNATTDEDMIIAWWTQYPEALIGMPTGTASGISVLDIDVKNGHDGERTLREIEERDGPVPDTTEVRTKSGGRHLWFKHAEGIQNSAGKLGDGLDVRGDGGYVIVPGSGNYAYVKENGFATAPAWIRGEVRGERAQQPAATAPSPSAATIPEGSRNAFLATEAGKLRRIGMPQAAIEAALLAINAERCQPALPTHEVRSIAASISRYPAEGTQEPALPPIPPWSELAIDPDEALAASPTPTCIVNEYLYADVAQLVAPGGTGKTTLLLWEAAHIVLGHDLWGQEVRRPGRVLVVTAEDERERLVARLERIIQAMGLAPAQAQTVYASIGIYDVAGSGIKLTQISGGNIVLTELADNLIEACRDAPPVMVVFDPLVSFGASEQAVNDNEQNLILAARRIVKGLGCCVRLVHHTGKMNARALTLDQYSGRGGSALADGSRMTAVMQVWSRESKMPLPEGMDLIPGDSVVVLNRAKLSYAPPNRPMWFIRRRGYSFAHSQASDRTPEELAEENARRLLHLLGLRIRRGRLSSKTDLESWLRDELDMPRAAYRQLVKDLLDSGRLVERELPKHLRQGRKRFYYCPADLADEALKVVPLHGDVQGESSEPVHSAEGAAE